MGRRPCCAKNEVLNRGSWTAVEDTILTDYVNVHGEGKWRNLPKKAGLKRCGKSCRLRWLNYLRPDIKRGNITRDEEDLIVRLHNLLGNRWSLIAGRLPGRTNNEIKNYWNTNIVKRMNQTTTSHWSNPKPLNQCLTNTVVRTKATRCTKAYIPTEQPKLSAELHETNSSAMAQQNLVLEDMPNKTEPLDFMMDFEMDDGFFSELLNTNISQFCDFEDEIVHGDDKSSTSNSCLNYSNSDQNLQSMASLLDSEINWFSD